MLEAILRSEHSEWQLLNDEQTLSTLIEPRRETIAEQSVAECRPALGLLIQDYQGHWASG